MEKQNTFNVIDWQEEPVCDLPAPHKMTGAVVKREFAGQLLGSETMQYVLSYRDEATSLFTGIGVLDGSFEDKSGLYCVVEHGTFGHGIVRANMSIHLLEMDSDLAHPIALGSYQSSVGTTAAYQLQSA